MSWKKILFKDINKLSDVLIDLIGPVKKTVPKWRNARIVRAQTETF